MTYAYKANRPTPLAAIGALGVPAAFGALLVTGLAITAVVKDELTVVKGYNIPVTIPEPEVTPEPKTTSSSEQTTIITPQPKTKVTPKHNPIETNYVDDIGPITLPIGGIGGSDDAGPIALPPPPMPSPSPRFDPIDAAPRGTPGGWVTDNDYRSSWINRGFEGVAGFTLQVSAEGRVTDCTITSSTGHNALDKATCRLITRRARFEPARNSMGEATSGRFSSSVNWRIP